MTLQPLIIIQTGNTKWTLDKYLDFASRYVNKLNLFASNNSSKVVGTTEDKQSIGISEIQDSIVFLSKIANKGELKLLVVDPADRLTEDAQNSMLKILEEPYESSLIILMVPSLRNLLATVVSRCKVEEVTKDNSSFFEAELVNKIINSNFFERAKIFEKLNTEVSRSEIKKTLEEVAEKLLTSFNPKLEDMYLLLELLISIESSINIKLILSNINVKFKKITGN
jgi:DNA polymerase III delta prime subunit